MIKFFRKIHLWLSVPFGIIITLICFSGAMLIFEPEITKAVRSDVYNVAEVKDKPLPMEQLMEAVKKTLPDSVSITGVTVFNDKSLTYQVNLSKPRRASVFVDQYSGEITGKYERLGFFTSMFRLHRWLLDSANPHGEGVKVGKLLVGISTIIFVIALISGIVIWWPRARKSLKNSLKISFNNGWKGFWKSLHVAGGMYALIFVLAMALTGLTYSFGWYRSAFYAVCGVEHQPRSIVQAPANGRADKERTNRQDGRPGGKDRHGNRLDKDAHDENQSMRGRGEGRRHSEFGRWQQVYNQLKAQNPQAPKITVGSETASVTIASSGNGRAADRYEFNHRTGEITPTTKYEDSNEADKLRGWIYAVHTGSFGGILTRILWLIGSLLGASLPLTGYYIWIRHPSRKRKAHVSPNT